MEPYPPKIKMASRPTVADKAPYASLVEVEDGTYYLQINQNQEYPAWYVMRNEQDALDRQKELLQAQQ